MVSTTIIFDKDNVEPPVFVAGAFTNWEPQEMTYKATILIDSTKKTFSYKAEISPGEYQYKFRLGPGDWWVVDESAPTATDENGNVNNVISVQIPKPSAEAPVETIAARSHVLNTRDAYIVEDKPEVNGVVEHTEPARPFPPPEEVISRISHSQLSEQGQVDAGTPRPEIEKQVHFDEQTGKITAEIVPSRKDSIPDFAPPPYSASASGTAVKPEGENERNPVAEGPAQTSTAKPAAGEAQPRKKQQSLIGTICSARGLATMVAMVAVPVAVSYYLRE